MTHSTQPLKNCRILNTRPDKAGQRLSAAIQQYGGIAIELPTLKITANEPTWLQDLPDLNTVEYALFISANAVDYCMEPLLGHDIYWPPHIKVIAIGQATVRALEHYHIKVAEVPALPDSEHILNLSCLQHVAQRNVILFKGNDGRPLIEEELKNRNAQLISIPVYKRSMPAPNYQFTDSLWRDDAVDIILLTSEQSIHNLFKLFSPQAHHWLHDKPCLVISERLGKIASLLGIKKIKISHPNRIIDTLFDYKDYMHGEEQ